MKNHKTTLVIVGVILSMTLNKTYAQSAPINLSIDEAVENAMENNPSIKSAYLEIEKQQSLKKTNFDLDQTAVNYTRGQINSPQIDYEWNISQDFKFPTIYGTQAKLQAEKLTLSETNLIVQKNKLERNVRAVYLELWYAKSKSNLITSLEKEYENFVLIAEKKYAFGESNLIEKIAAEGKKEAVNLLKSDVELDIESLTKQLQSLMNTNVNFEISNEDLAKIPFEFSNQENIENPILQLQQNEIDVKEREYKLENAKFLPELSAGYFNQQIDGIKGFSGFEVGAKIPLFFWSQNGKSLAAKKNVEIAALNYQETKLEIDTFLKTKLNEYEKQKAALAYYDSTGIVLADKLFSSAIKAYKEGEIGYVEYIAIMEQSIDIRTNYLTALNLHNQIVNEINYLTGKYN